MAAGEISGQISRLIEQSRSLEAVGDIGGAFQLATEAVQLSQAEGDSAGTAAALLGLAYVHFRIGHDEEVIRLARQALDLAPADSRLKVDALMMLGAAGEAVTFKRFLAIFHLQEIRMAAPVAAP